METRHIYISFRHFDPVWQAYLGWTETKLWTLKYGSKSIQTSLILRKRPPKSYKLLKFFISFVTTVKSCHAPSVWKKMRWKSLCLLILKSITEIIKYFKSLYDFGGRCVKIRDVCMDFEPYFKVHILLSVHPKSVILGQMTNLNMVFYIVVSVYRLVKILKLALVPWWISERLIPSWLIYISESGIIYASFVENVCLLTGWYALLISGP